MAIAADAVAFRLWNLAARSPARLVSDLATGFSATHTAVRGTARFAGGLVLLTVAAALVMPAAIEGRTFAVLETWTLLTGLFVDGLIGTVRRP